MASRRHPVRTFITLDFPFQRRLPEAARVHEPRAAAPSGSDVHTSYSPQQPVPIGTIARTAIPLRIPVAIRSFEPSSPSSARDFQNRPVCRPALGASPSRSASPSPSSSSSSDRQRPGQSTKQRGERHQHQSSALLRAQSRGNLNFHNPPPPMSLFLSQSLLSYL